MQQRTYCTLPPPSLAYSPLPENLRPFPLSYPSEVIALIALLLTAFAVEELVNYEYMKFANISIAMTLIVILSAQNYLHVSKRPEILWAPIFWFRIGSALYAGLGSIVPYVVNSRTERFLRSVFDYTDGDVLKVLQIYICSIAIVMFVASFFVKRPQPNEMKQAVDPRQMNHMLLLAALAFLLLGGLIRYGLLIPRMYGLIDTQFPGSLVMLSKSYVAGLFLLLLYSLRTGKCRVLAITLIAIDMLAGLLAFDKSELIGSLIFSYLALIYHKMTTRRVLIGSALAFSLLIVTQPLVHFGRAEVSELNSGDGKVATVSQRLEILERYFEHDPYAVPSNVEEKDPILRLSYISPSAFVVDQYDRGYPGDSFRYVLAILVPRILWPEKPATGVIGGELYELVRGKRGASIGMTHFADAYWNFGWWGLPFVFVPGGFILSLISLYTIGSVRRNLWLRLPVILIGVNMGYRVSGSFVSDIVGTAAIFLVLVVITYWAERFVLAAPTTERQQSAPA